LSIEEYEIIIIGAGPSGLSAGIFVSRQQTKCLLISKDLGGQLNLIPKLENYPGTMMSSGPLLAKTLENQFMTFGGDMIYDTVVKVEEIGGNANLLVKTTRSKYRTKSLVLATGKVPNNLGIENEAKFRNKGLHYCTKCDVPFYQGRITATVGVGEYLLESGVLLSRMTSKVYLIYRGGQLGGDKDMIELLKKKKNVELVPNSSVISVSGNNYLQQVRIKNNRGVEKLIDVDGLFVEMGSKINLDFIKHLIKINSKGEIEVTDGGKTSYPGVFAAGDATNIPYKQIISACGDGSAAGIAAFNYVVKLKGNPGIRSDWKKRIGDTIFHY
jgi:thioredoxin reductase (NADPH)